MDAPTRGFRRCTVVFAHMDDEINACGLLSRLRAEGTELDIVVLTDGAANPWTDARVVGNRTHFECRRDELARSMELLSIGRSVLPQLPDGQLTAHLEQATALLQDELRARQADLIVTFEPSGINRHRDHVAAHLATRRALARAGHLAALAMVTPPPPFRWVLGSGFADAEPTPVRTLQLSAAEREQKARVFDVYASQARTLRLLTGGLPPRTFFRLFPNEWYVWLDAERAVRWSRKLDEAAA